MKSNTTIIELFMWSVLIFSFGCSTGSGVLKADKSWPASSKLEVSSIQSRHSGYSLAHIVPIVGHSIAESFMIEEKVQYTERLNLKCLKAIEEVLSQSGDFRYVSGNKLSVNEYGDLIRFSPGKSALNLEIQFDFLASSLWAKSMVLHARWIVSDSAGQKRADVETAIAGEPIEESFPDTRNPEYEETFIELARKSAEDFLLLLNTQIPKYSRARIWIWFRY